MGFKVETFSKSKIDFTVFDMSGQSKYRQLWEQYYDESEVTPPFTDRIGDHLRGGLCGQTEDQGGAQRAGELARTPL